MKTKILRISCLLVAVLSVSACIKPKYVDPYSGKTLPQSTLKKQGIISAVTDGLGNGFTFDEYDKAPELRSPKYAQVQSCSSSSGVAYLRSLRTAIEDMQYSGYVLLSESGRYLKVTLPGHYAFEFDSAHFKESFYPALNELVTILNEHPRTRINIDGHASGEGSERYNNYLSELRAYNLERYLNKHGVDPSRTVGVGLGTQQPLFDTSPGQVNPRNRRVVLSICSVPFDSSAVFSKSE